MGSVCIRGVGGDGGGGCVAHFPPLCFSSFNIKPIMFVVLHLRHLISKSKNSSTKELS